MCVQWLTHARVRATPAPGPAAPRAQGCEAHGVTGLVNLYGIESPGLTASLALGAHVAAKLLGSSGGGGEGAG